MDLEFKKELEEVMGYLEKLPAKGAGDQKYILKGTAANSQLSQSINHMPWLL